MISESGPSKRPRETTMNKQYDRRQILQGMSAACATYLLKGKDQSSKQSLRVAGRDVEVQIVSVSEHTFRLSVLPLKDGQVAEIPKDGSLVRDSWGAPVAIFQNAAQEKIITCDEFNISVNFGPLTFTIEKAKEKIQTLQIDEETGIVSFVTGDSPLLALGEGGPQFDRRGNLDAMRSGQGGYKLATHGGRVPIPWLIGTAGWAIFFHQPFGTFDFTGPESKFLPESAD